MQKLVIYHGGGCADGWCSAWLFKRAFPDAELLAVNYGEVIPDVSGKEVYILDFSYLRQDMLYLIQQCRGHLTVFDHHKTAEKELLGICEQCAQLNPGQLIDQLPSITFNMKKSGAMLTWEFLYPKNVTTWIVDYVQDRDLWEWKLPLSKEINANLRSFPQTMEAWNAILACDPAVFAVEGGAILRDQAATVAQHVARAKEVEISGHKILAVNATTLSSEIAGELAKDRPFGATFFDDGAGYRIWSLRSREGGIDVSEVAKSKGGGGHKAAAGFREPIG